MLARAMPLTTGRGISAKTPGKGLRAGMRDENILHQMQTVGKGKLPPKTPGKSIIAELGRSTLADKTPFPNQKLPGMAGKSGKHIILEVPGSAARPSSTRKKVKLPQGGGKVMFQTPAPSGKAHWDVSDGDVDISVALSEDNASVMSEDDDDFEYMPPTAIDLPYEPDFDFPNARQTGQTLVEIFRIPPYEMIESSDVALSTEEEAKIFDLAGGDHTINNWPQLDLKPITSDDPFPHRPVAVKAIGSIRRPPNSPTALSLRIRPASTVPIVSTRSRTQTPVSARATPLPKPTLSRPATAMLRRPAVPIKPSAKAMPKNTYLGRNGAQAPAKVEEDGLDSLLDVPNTEDNFMFDV